MAPLLARNRAIRLVSAVAAFAAFAALATLGAGAPHRVVPHERWYAVHTVRDMTGDGHADTLTLEAFGNRPDSLLMFFRIRGGDRDLFHLEWSSGERYLDLMYDHGKPTISLDSLTRLVHSEMDEFFESTKFENAASLPFEKTWHVQPDGDDPRDYVAYQLRYDREIAARRKRGELREPKTLDERVALDRKVRHSPFDTSRVRAIGREMQRSGLPAFTFSYGYESTEAITWSPTARKFFEVFYSD
jgi:hypothetical protein